MCVWGVFSAFALDELEVRAWYKKQVRDWMEELYVNMQNDIVGAAGA